MTWEPHDEEILAMLRLGPTHRYEYFIKKVVDEGKLCGLWKKGWALAGNEIGDQLIPVWPHSKYATLCAFDQWDGFSPKAIGLEAWFETWTPGLIRDHCLLAVFPTPQNEGILIAADCLAVDLNRENQNYI